MNPSSSLAETDTQEIRTLAFVRPAFQTDILFAWAEANGMALSNIAFVKLALGRLIFTDYQGQEMMALPAYAHIPNQYREFALRDTIAKIAGAFPQHTQSLLLDHSGLEAYPFALSLWHGISYQLWYTGERILGGNDFCILHNATKINIAETGKQQFKERTIYQLNDDSCEIEQHIQPRTDSSTSSADNLLVAYFAGKMSSVGVFRANYWFDQFGSDLGGLDLVTSIAPQGRPDNHHFVPDYAGRVKSKRPEASLSYLPGHSGLPLDPSFDTLGLYWPLELEHYFDARPHLKYKNVIITGNPFMHFGFSKYAKEKWGAKIILDYRDPFTENPRINCSRRARAQMEATEEHFNQLADGVITVNKYCADMTKTDKSITLIDNGFDERNFPKRIVKSRKQTDPQICFAGNFYRDCSPYPFIEAVGENAVAFDLVGSGGRHFPISKMPQHENINFHAQRPYADTIEIMRRGHLGIIFTSGKVFESTTKIFDYIGCDLDILIVTGGEPQTGAIHEISKDLEGVYWCQNEKEQISEFLKFYSQEKPYLGRKTRKQRMNFSRAAGLDKLKSLLKT